MRTIIVTLILLGIILYGCTTADKTVNEILKSTPEIQQFLKENPGTIIRTLYLDESSVEASIEEIRSLCGPQIPVKPYYEVKISASSIDLVAYIDTVAKRLECSVLRSKIANNTYNNDSIIIKNNPPPPPVENSPACKTDSDCILWANSCDDVNYHCYSLNDPDLKRSKTCSGDLPPGPRPNCICQNNKCIFDREVIQLPPPQPPPIPPRTVILDTWLTCQQDLDCATVIDLSLDCAFSVNKNSVIEYTRFCNQKWGNNNCLTSADVCPDYGAKCVNGVCKAEKMIFSLAERLGRVPASELLTSTPPTCNPTIQAADVSVRWKLAQPSGSEQVVQFSMSEGFEEQSWAFTTSRLVEGGISSGSDFSLIHSQTYFWRIGTHYEDGWLFSSVENFTNPQCVDYFLT